MKMSFFSNPQMNCYKSDMPVAILEIKSHLKLFLQSLEDNYIWPEVPKKHLEQK